MRLCNSAKIVVSVHGQSLGTLLLITRPWDFSWEKIEGIYVQQPPNMGFWSSNSKDDSSQPKQSTRDQEADAELAELIAAFSQEPSPNPDDEKKRVGRDRGEIDNDTAYTSTFPGEMNCVTAFDEMFYCYSIGGQFLNGMSFFACVGMFFLG